MAELLQLAVDGRVSTHVKVFNLEDVNVVMRKLQSYEVEGRIILRIPPVKTEF